VSRSLSAFALLSLTALAAPADERPAVTPTRTVYIVKHASARALATVLAKHFKGVAEINAGPEGTSNCLLISAPPLYFAEVIKTIEKLDRRPHSVAIEVFIVELAPRKGDEEDKGPDVKAFSGDSEAVAKRLRAMAKKGELAGYRRISLTTLEGQLGSLMLGENRPYVMGATVTGTGLVSKSITYRNVGTQVKVTPRVDADRSITLELSVQDSRSRDSATATVGNDEKGKPIPAADFIQTTLTGTVRVASGKVAVAKDARVVSKAGKGETLIIVGARVVEAEREEK
jgi:type II secretory pathway component GspD/PulD (secretin)